MKKQVGLLIASVTLLTALPLAAKAADGDTDTTKSTTAEIELTQDPDDKDIKLVGVPALNFGIAVNPNKGATYNPTGQLANIEVHNPGNTSGWNVQVSRSAFAAVDNDGKLTGGQLKSEVLSFKNGNVSAADHTNASTPPTAKSIDMDKTDSNYSIFTAGENTGIGDFLLSHNLKDVALAIPAGNVAGKYKSTLTWTLANAPSGTTTPGATTGK